MNAHRKFIGLLLAMGIFSWGPPETPAQGEDAPVIQSRRLDAPAEPTPTAGAAEPVLAPPSIIQLGIAPAMIDGNKRVETLATVFGEMGAKVVKNDPWLAEWGGMQRSARSRIKFGDLDQFVRSFQGAGFHDIMLCLRSNCKWASRDYDRERSPDPTPKPEFHPAFTQWITAIVERYDGDGVQDMEGLLRPVRLYELGAQFSAAEPAPADAYVEMLRLTYDAAHAAFSGVQIAHAGFVTTGAFDRHPGPDEYEAAFASAGRLLHHDLHAVRTVLDAHAAYDLVNLHSLGEPRELDRMVEWIRFELNQRNIDKPIILGQASPSPLITHGPATDCNLPPEQMGVVVAPAREEDRCRLARYLSNLVDGDEYSELWAHRYTAADMIKKVVIAAEHDFLLINTSYMEDRGWQQKKSYQAAAGHTPWSGMVDLRRKGRRPAFLALNQLAQRLRAYEDVVRLRVDDPTVAIYQVNNGDEKSWIAWLEPERLALPHEPSPRIEIDLPVTMSTVMVERMIAKDGQVHATRKAVIPIKGIIPVVLTPYPTYVYSRF